MHHFRYIVYHIIKSVARPTQNFRGGKMKYYVSIIQNKSTHIAVDKDGKIKYMRVAIINR